jgi:hypothetical protein
MESYTSKALWESTIFKPSIFKPSIFKPSPVTIGFFRIRNGLEIRFVNFRQNPGFAGNLRGEGNNSNERLVLEVDPSSVPR